MDLLYTHTHCCLGQDLFINQHVASWPWPSDDFDIQHCSLTICVKVLFFSYNLFYSWQSYFILTHNIALVKTFTLICWKIRKIPALMRDQHFPLVKPKLKKIIFWLIAFFVCIYTTDITCEFTFKSSNTSCLFIPLILFSGMHGVYQGLVPTILKQGSNQAMRFFVMESCKNWYRDGDPNVKVPTLVVGAFGALAGAVSVYGNTPIDVIKTRLQVSHDVCYFCKKMIVYE